MILLDERALPGEEWRPVVGWESKYLVSSLGRIYSIPRHKVRGGVLSPTTTAKGYLRCCLPGDAGVSRNLSVHRLVAVAFLGEPKEGQEVRHLNGDPADNRVENLAWGTHAENVADSVLHGSHPEARKTRCPLGHPYDDENTAFDQRDHRICRACRRAHHQELAERRRLDGKCRTCPDCGTQMRADSMGRHVKESCPLRQAGVAS